MAAGTQLGKHCVQRMTWNPCEVDATTPGLSAQSINLEEPIQLISAHSLANRLSCIISPYQPDRFAKDPERV